ncbi:MAG TPA: ATP-binding cassette domain-containing protein [Bacilli bacterium]|nr:ATP-binding cassette domain-containing protein [Bacilli bacterium]
MSQDIFIYNASGMDNVTLFDYKRKKDLDYYIDLLKVRELMERNLGELGRNISGGEKNRIAILRALNMERKIIVLDESLANLDELNKKEITDFLLGLKDIMIILITHDYDEDYLNKFDEIIKMEKGKVKEIKKNMKI